MSSPSSLGSSFPISITGSKLQATFLLLGFVVYAVTTLEKWTRHNPLADVPGPPLARWSPLWLIYHARFGQRYRKVDEAHQKYGSVVLISPNHVSIADPDALAVVYGQGSHALDKSQFYDGFLSGGKASIFSTRDRQDHAKKRHLVSHAFSTTSLKQFVPIIHDNAEHFARKMDEMASNGKVFDALLYFNYFAFDVLSDLAFGEPIGMVKKGSDLVSVEDDRGTREENAIELVDGREHLAAVLGLHWSLRIPYIANIIPDRFFSAGKKASSGLDDLGRRLVNKRIATGGDRDDILSKLIESRVSDPALLTPEQIVELTAESVTLLIAGSDTTSNSITAILYYIVMHPEVHKTLLEVLESTIDPAEVPRQEDVENIAYLEATINEGLRLHATTAFGLPRTVTSKGLKFKEYYFPPGTELSVPAWTIQHDANIWGDPENFRPERWLEKKDSKSYLLTFGKGPRACIGRNLAYMEMSLIVAMIVLRYDIELQSPELRTTEGFMHKPLSLMVKLRSRH